MAEREKIALFLGAGASKAFRFPITGQILPLILEKLDTGELFGDDSASREELGQFLGRLVPGLSRENARHILITEVLSLMDHMIQNGIVPHPRARLTDMVALRMVLERAILEVLRWPYDPNREDQVPGPLKALAGWIYEAGRRSYCSLISTNYDEAVETELYRRVGGGDHEEVNRRIDFGLSWRECSSGSLVGTPADPRYSVLKLHGSVGWLRCEMCNFVVCNEDYIYSTEEFFRLSFSAETEANRCPCGHWPLRPVIVAPSLVRDIRDTNLLSVWKSALEALRASDRWYIVGYSLPPEDLAIRSVLIRAYHGRRPRPRIEVVQLGRDEATFARYKMYFPECEYYEGGMEGFIERIGRGEVPLPGPVA